MVTNRSSQKQDMKTFVTKELDQVDSLQTVHVDDFNPYFMISKWMCESGMGFDFSKIELKRGNPKKRSAVVLVLLLLVNQCWYHAHTRFHSIG